MNERLRPANVLSNQPERRVMGPCLQSILKQQYEGATAFRGLEELLQLERLREIGKGDALEKRDCTKSVEVSAGFISAINEEKRETVTQKEEEAE